MADNKARRRRKIFNPRGANAFETDAKDPDRTQEKSIPSGSNQGVNVIRLGPF